MRCEGAEHPGARFRRVFRRELVAPCSEAVRAEVFAEDAGRVVGAPARRTGAREEGGEFGEEVAEVGV